MDDRILLDAGSGGRASQRLVKNIFQKHLNNDIMASMDDAALLPSDAKLLSMSIDGYTVSPLFFPGGSIGTLAVNGTVNDISMLGAEPLWLSAGFIVEEGLPLATLESAVEDMARACAEANVKIAAGDTKVVPQGACDKLFITTSGIGRIYAEPQPGGACAKEGDAILLSGAIGDHGMAIMAAREDLSFLSDARSDCAPLNHMIADIFDKAGVVHVLRDPTRGGLATTLNEIAEQSGACMEIWEAKVPLHASVAEGCSFLGLDPFYLANEGKCICILPEEKAQAALDAMRASRYGAEAAIIGRVTGKRPGKVVLHTRMGGERFLGMLEGAPLPRIC